MVGEGAHPGTYEWLIVDHDDPNRRWTGISAQTTSRLSMDYEVFLLSRISEYHDSGQPNDQAVTN